MPVQKIISCIVANINTDVISKRFYMHRLIKESTRQKFIGLFSIAIMMFLFLSCNNKSTPAIVGTYRIYSEDPSIQRWIAGEDTYFKLNDDHTIIYNSTINGKPKFNFDGNFVLDQKTNELTIDWNQGKLPNKLQVQQVGSDYIIQVGTTTYKKQKAKS